MKQNGQKPTEKDRNQQKWTKPERNRQKWTELTKGGTEEVLEKIHVKAQHLSLDIATYRLKEKLTK